MWPTQALSISITALSVVSATTLHWQRDLPFSDNSTGALAFSPPKYPTPWASGAGQWADAYAKARDFVGQLTLLEKVNLTTGVGWQGESCVGEVGSIPRLGFRGLCMQDSPLGVRSADYVSAFPAGINVGATWSRELAYARGEAMGAEHRGKGVDVQLGPVCGALGRAPAAGRNWEAFSPDPYLTGALINPTIRGIQDAGVVACTKHYVGNEQEHFRQAPESQNYGFNITESSSSNIDDKTMHELYLWPFADAVRAGTGAIMCSYQQLNNSYGCQNSYALNYLLKNELDFQGFVMSDWGAQHAGVGSILAGIDMSMPGDTSFYSGVSFLGTNLTIAVANGTVPEWRLDDACVRIMSAYYLVGRDEARVPVNFNSWSRLTFAPIHASTVETGMPEDSPIGLVNEHVDVRAGHASLIRDIGRASTVLLKNNDRALPLSGRERQVGIFGEDAGSNAYGANGCPDRGCDNGTLAMGWGSGTAEFPYLVTPEQAIQNYVITQTDGLVYAVTAQGAVDEVANLAPLVDVALVFVNADSGEGYISVDGNEGDRNNLTLWKQGDELIRNVSSQCNNTIVVMHTVGPVLVTDWYDNDNITAILWAGLPGQESGNAIVDVLYGQYNPGGKLPFTLGRTREAYGPDVLYTPNNGQFDAPQDDFTEGVFIDYRSFDKMNSTPIYEFGFGLSYTTFEYKDLVVTNRDAEPYVPSEGTTPPAPSSGDNASMDYSQYLFPDESFRPIPNYIYPYLNSTDPETASGDPDYGLPASEYIPPGATDGSPQPILPAGGAPGGNAGLWDVLYRVTATVTNTGSIGGEEVVQLYVSLGGDEPPVVLRGFDRLTISSGDSVEFFADLTRRDLSIWDTASQDWVPAPGPVTVYVGSSSRKLPLSATVDPY